MHNLWANTPKSISTFFFFPALLISFTPFDFITLNTIHFLSVLQTYYQDTILRWGCNKLLFFIRFFIDMFSSVQHNFEALQFILQWQSVLFIHNWTYFMPSPLMSENNVFDFQLPITNLLSYMFCHPPTWLFPKAPKELKVYFVKTSWLHRSICCETFNTGKFSRFWWKVTSLSSKCHTYNIKTILVVATPCHKTNLWLLIWVVNYTPPAPHHKKTVNSDMFYSTL